MPVFLAVMALTGVVSTVGAQDAPPVSEPETAPAAAQAGDGSKQDGQTPVVLTEEQMSGTSIGARPFLSRALARATRRVLIRAKPELIHLRLAFAFSAAATQFGPSDIECWRLLLAIAGASDPEDPQVQAAEARALTEISRLDPSDSVIRLRRLLLAVEQGQTVEDRLLRFEKLLEPESIELLGTDVAARLAMNMAQLLQRSGDDQGFLERLAEAVALDPSYPRATAWAVAYFADSDPVTNVELLVTALLADPMEVVFASKLGLIALQEGSYTSAVRMLGLANAVADEADQTTNDLVLQHALALWGAGRSTDALNLLASRQRQLEAYARAPADDQNSFADPAEEEDAVLPEPLQMSMLKAAILSQSGDKQAYRQYVSDVMKRLVGLMSDDSDLPLKESSDEEFIDPVQFLEAAAFAAWQGEDAALIDEFVSAARQQSDLTPEALGRFEAWRAIARGDSELAIEILTQLDAEDDLAALALSIAYERAGRSADAARIWLRLARSASGTVIGVWCKHQLEKALGSTLPPSAEAGKIASHIDKIPRAYDRIILGRDMGYALRLQPVEYTVQPFGPLVYSVEITNKAPSRISIGPGGPILPTAHFGTTVTVAGSSGSVNKNHQIIAIDRHLGVNPNETYELEIDLSYYPVSEVAVIRAEDGMTFDSRLITNFTSDGMSAVPGPFGEKVNARLMRVDGITPDAPYRREAFETIERMDGAESLNTLLLMVDVAMLQIDSANNQEALAFRRRVLTLLVQNYVKLPADARAWLAYVLPLDEGLPDYKTVRDMILADDNPLVQMMLLAKLTWSARQDGARNPVLVTLTQSSNEGIADLARDLQQVWEIADLEEREASSVFGR